MHPTPNFPTYFPNTYSDILPTTPRFSECSFLSGFPTQIFYFIRTSHLTHACYKIAHLNLFEFIALIIFGEGTVIKLCTEIIKSRDSSVGIALGYGLDYRGSRVRFPTVAGNFSPHHRIQNGSGAPQPPIQRAPGSLSLRVKRPGREAGHSPPSSAEVKE
jgi:hypothetical protein